MKIYSLSRTPFEPVSHDPGLKKRVLVTDEIPHVRNISHVLLRAGDRASSHSHKDAFEVLYCLRGRVVFEVEGRAVTVEQGDCIVIEPSEVHSIPQVVEDTELFYFKVPV